MAKKIGKDEKDLYSSILKLKSVEECRNFFRDLCTPAEIKAMQERWKVCNILAKENLSYREINKKTGISLTTIGRVARFLHQEEHQGYKLILDRNNLKSERH